MTAYTRAMEFVDETDAPYPVGLLYVQMGVAGSNALMAALKVKIP